MPEQVVQDPPAVDPRKQALLAELRRRAGTDERKLALVGELERRYGAPPPVPTTPTFGAPLGADVQGPGFLDSAQELGGRLYKNFAEQSAAGGHMMKEGIDNLLPTTDKLNRASSSLQGYGGEIVKGIKAPFQIGMGGLQSLLSPVMGAYQTGVEALSGGRMIDPRERGPQDMPGHLAHMTKQALAFPITGPQAAVQGTADVTGMSEDDANLLIGGLSMAAPFAGKIPRPKLGLNLKGRTRVPYETPRGKIPQVPTKAVPVEAAPAAAPTAVPKAAPKAPPVPTLRVVAKDMIPTADGPMFLETIEMEGGGYGIYKVGDPSPAPLAQVRTMEEARAFSKKTAQKVALEQAKAKGLLPKDADVPTLEPLEEPQRPVAASQAPEVTAGSPEAHAPVSARPGASQALPKLELPEEVLKVARGESRIWGRPPRQEGTLPTKGEQALSGASLEEIVRTVDPQDPYYPGTQKRKVEVYKAKDGSEFLFNPRKIRRQTLIKAEEKGRLWELVNGKGTAPKPDAPTAAVVARDASGNEVRTVLTDTPEKTAAAVKAQESQGLQAEVVPATPESLKKVLNERVSKSPKGLPPGSWDEMVRADELTSNLWDELSKTDEAYKNDPGLQQALADEARTEGLSVRELLLKEGKQTGLEDTPAWQALRKSMDEGTIISEVGESATPPVLPSKKTGKMDLRLKQTVELEELGYPQTGEGPLNVKSLRGAVKKYPFINKLRERILKEGIRYGDPKLVEILQETQREHLVQKAAKPKDGPTLGMNLGAAGPLLEKSKAKSKAKIKELAIKGTDILSRPFESSLDEISRTGQAGRRIAEKQVDVQVDTNILTEGPRQRLIEARTAIPLKDRRWLAEHMQQAIERPEEVTLTPAQQNYLKVWNQVQADAERIGYEAGKRIVDESGPRRAFLLGERYHPHVLRPDILQKLLDGDPEITRQFEELNVGKDNPFTDRADFDKAFRSYRDNYSKGLDPGTELPRKFKYKDEWLAKEGFEVHERWLEHASKSTAEQMHFHYRTKSGKARYVTPEGVPQGDLGPLLNLVRQEGGAKGAANAEMVADIMKSIQHRDRMPSTREWLQKAQNAEGLATTALKIGGNLTLPIRQASQQASLTRHAGPKAAFGGLLDAARHPLDARRRAVLEAGAPRLMHYAETAGLDLPSTLRNKARRVVDVLASPTAFGDAVARTIASEAAPRWGLQQGELLRKGGAAAERAERQLRGMYLDDAEIARLRNGTQTARDMTKLRQRFVMRNQISATRGELPHYLNHPLWQTPARLKKFTVGQARFDIQHTLGEAAHGNFRPLRDTLVWGTLYGEGIGAALDAILGPSPAREKSLKEIVEDQDGKALAIRLMDDMSNVALLGIVGQLAFRTGNAVLRDKKMSILDNPVTDVMKPPVADEVSEGYRSGVRVLRGEEDLADEALHLLQKQSALAKQAVKAYDYHHQDILDLLGEEEEKLPLRLRAR